LKRDLFKMAFAIEPKEKVEFQCRTKDLRATLWMTSEELDLRVKKMAFIIFTLQPLTAGARASSSIPFRVFGQTPTCPEPVQM
jgi:hypothetical protein